MANGNSNGNGKPLKKVRIDDLLTIQPITDNQKIIYDAYKDDKHLLLHGIAGTGKTFLSLYLALEEVLDPSTVYDDVFIVRSVVSTRDIGFLPGDEQEKVSIYEAPYRSICRELFGIKDSYDALKQQGNIKFMSTSFIRGITINNAVIIVDECQNLNFHELDSIITRVGENTRIVFCGDAMQSDLQRDKEKNGIHDFMRILEYMPDDFTMVEMGIDDICRSGLVRNYLLAKNQVL